MIAMKPHTKILVFLFLILGSYHQSVASQTSIAEDDPLSHIPTSFSIDKGKALGEIPFSQSVNSGILSYTVPIEVYPGRKNFQPAISLNYNSYNGFGPAGVGWQIGGLSSISLVNKNIYFDGYNGEGELNASGSYTLDGNRLIRLSADSNKIYYQTEQGNIKVTAFLNNTAIKYFEVSYPDGKKATFGFKDNRTNSLFYPITKLEDLTGCYMDYIYDRVSKYLFKINEIRYGATNNTSRQLPHYASIRFKYGDYIDNLPWSYSHDEIITQHQLLQAIETRFNNKIIKVYTLKHDNIGGLYFLKNIGCESGGQSMNPVTFYYGENHKEDAKLEKRETQIGFTFVPSEADADTIHHLLSKGKFEKKDGVMVNPAHYGVYGARPKINNRDTYILGPAIYGETKAGLMLPKLHFFVSPNVEDTTSVGDVIEEGFTNLFTADIDGDGTDEIVKVNHLLDDDTYKTSLIQYTTYKISHDS